MCYISVHLLVKNFTALIPGTTVEILDQDSKNIIQLIINAYNVSKGALRHIVCVCLVSTLTYCESRDRQLARDCLCLLHIPLKRGSAS